MRRCPTRPEAAFSLIEMLVVITVIVILAAIVLPSATEIFTAGADAQAYNILAGQLIAARTLALQKNTHAGVHVQLADPEGEYSGKLKSACYVAVILYRPDDPDDPDSPSHFDLAEGFSPRKLPGGMALGRLTDPFVNNDWEYDGEEVTEPEFTTLTFVFSPTGQLVTNVMVTFNPNTPVMKEKNEPAYLWNPDVAKDSKCNKSVRAAILFNRNKLLEQGDDDARAEYLTLYGQMVAVNPYTAALLGR